MLAEYTIKRIHYIYLNMEIAGITTLSLCKIVIKQNISIYSSNVKFHIIVILTFVH